MADDTDVLLKLYEQEWAQARHIEEQRAAITNLILIISAAVLGLISQKGLTPELLPLTLLIIALGIYGVVVTQKLYERHHFCVDRARFWRKRIDELHPNALIEKTKSDSDAFHLTKFPRLEKLKLHHLWNILHLAIALTGLVLSIIIMR